MTNTANPAAAPDAHSEDTPPDTGALRTPPVEDRGHTWASRIYSARHSARSSPRIAKLSFDQDPQGQMSELEKMWDEFGITARAECAVVEPVAGALVEEPVSDGSTTEEDRILC